MIQMKKMSRILSAFLVVVTLVALLGVLPREVSAAGVDAPSVSISNVASSGKIKLTWGEVEDAVKYEVYRATSKTGKYSRRTTTTNLSFTNTNAEAGKTYYYKVRAIAADGSYAESKILSRTCDLARPVTSISNTASSGYPKLTWDAVGGAVSYKVYRATSKTGEYKLMKTTTSTSYTNSTAEVGKTYYYKVMAVASKSAANSAYSSVKSRTCDLPRTTVTLSNDAATGKISVSWKAISGARGYEIFKSTDGENYYLLDTVTGTSLVDTASVAGEVCYYQVRALASKSAADSAWSSAKYRTADLAQPQVTASRNSKGKPQLKWEPIEGAVSYKVYRATSRNGSYSVMKTTTSTSYTNTSAVDGTTYYYKVRAISGNTSAHSAYSDIHAVQSGSDSKLRYVNTTSLYLYKSASSSSKYVKVPYMTELTLAEAVTSGSSGKWYKVYYQGNPYYVWITPDSDKLTTVQTGIYYEGNTPLQQEILDLAMTIYHEWETDYISGESGVKHSNGKVGFDCSGFTCYIINTVMQQYVPTYRLLPDTGSLFEVRDIYNTGYTGEFKAIDVKSIKDAQPGDMLFFCSAETGRLNHCGLYLGNGEFIHCTSTWDGVCLMPLSGSFEERLIGIKRFVPEEVVPANQKRYMSSGCKLYEDRKCEGDVIMRLSKGEAVTVLFTKPDSTAYVRTADGTCGFVFVKYLSKTK